MAQPAETKLLHTIREYLDFERSSPEKHEYRDGEILLMAGGTLNHGTIAGNMIRHLGNALEGKPCRVVPGDVRIRIPRTPLFTYPDVSVICGKPRYDPSDPHDETLISPRLIVEVLSPSTEAYDRGEKFRRYRQLDSLEEYVLVSQESARVETFFRQADGTWLMTPVEGLEFRVRLRALEIELPLAAIFAGVEFPPPQGPVEAALDSGIH